jgi:hypothetical protein
LFYLIISVSLRDPRAEEGGVKGKMDQSNLSFLFTLKSFLSNPIAEGSTLLSDFLFCSIQAMTHIALWNFMNTEMQLLH